MVWCKKSWKVLYFDKWCIIRVPSLAEGNGGNLFSARFSTSKMAFFLSDVTFWLKTQNFHSSDFFQTKQIQELNGRIFLGKPYALTMCSPEVFWGFLNFISGKRPVEPLLFFLPGFLLSTVLIFRRGRATSFGFSTYVFVWIGRKLIPLSFLGRKTCSSHLLTVLIPIWLASSCSFQHFGGKRSVRYTAYPVLLTKPFKLFLYRQMKFFCAKYTIFRITLDCWGFPR